MKELNIKQLSRTVADARHIPALLDAAQVAFTPIDTVNWQEYPYAPSAEFRMGYTDEALLLHYRVSEASVRALAERDNGAVWKDACVEFFLTPGEDGHTPGIEEIYYNIECNCAGTLLIGSGTGRHNRVHAPQEVMDGVLRWSSLGREPFAERVGDCAWEVALLIPLTTFFRHAAVSLRGKSVRANFYKCGDELRQPHFLSWNPIDLPNPDFHCPAFFGTLHFQA